MTRTPESGEESALNEDTLHDDALQGETSREDAAAPRGFAAFETVADLRSAYAAAIEEGLDANELEVLSNVPIEGFDGPKSRVLVYALGGALLGGLTVFLLATESAKAYPLVTGGMPIVAGPAVGLVTYEGTALGAILATVLGVLWEGRIFRRARSDDAAAEAVQDLLARGLHVLAVAPGSGELGLPESAFRGDCAVGAIEAESGPEPGSG